MTRRGRALTVAIVIASLAVGAVALKVTPIAGTSGWQSAAWRLGLYARKTTGQVPELSWPELWRMTRHRGGFGLAGIVEHGRSPDGSVSNPYVTEADRHAGAEIYRQQCITCHGSEGRGGNAPALVGRELEHGNTDLALYRVLRDGIADSSMSAAALAWDERWQVVGYVRSLQAATSTTAGPMTTGSVGARLSSDALRNTGTRSGEWPTYSGSIDGTRYTPSSEINRNNVSELRIRWVQQFEMADEPIEATPLVVGGRMFLTLPAASVVALDARKGSVVWRYDHPLPPVLPLCCRRINRGVAMLDDVLYFASLDANLVALDANTGRVKWRQQVASPADGYTMTGAPLVAGRSVVVGLGGAEFGIRGFLAAYDALTGALQWKFETIPGPGSRGHETWENDAWRTGGGSTWVTGSYDPVLDLIFWGVGNPAPDFAGDERPGDNLFTNSVVALHAQSGKLAWYFQFTPHDVRDWDSAQTPVLAELSIRGEPLQVICWPNRNGFYYVLERSTGRFLAGVPFVDQNWATGLDAAGRPALPDVPAASDGRRLIKPGVGGTIWQNAAFDATTGLIFIPATEGASVFTQSSPAKRGSAGYLLGSSGSPVEGPIPVVRALDAATGARRWENYSPPLGGGSFSYSGLLATGGGLVFGASGGTVFALDSMTGRELWEVSLGGDSRAAPISFTVDGQQLIAVSVGRSLFVFALGAVNSRG